MSEMKRESAVVSRAVILARGLGTRMRREDGTALSGEQASVAGAGVKAMIRIGRPFLDYVISALADAGIGRVCLVIGPEHDVIRNHYSTVETRRVAIEFAIQEKPLGTANALLAAEESVTDELFLVLNSDNYYPVSMYRTLRRCGESSMVGFVAADLVRNSNIPAERIAKYAVVERDEEGYLRRIIEKPEDGVSQDSLISMNCWCFGSWIFEACRRVPISGRGEYELPQAVQFGIEQMDEKVRLLESREGVLDLSQRSDIAEVAARLAGVEVRL